MRCMILPRAACVKPKTIPDSRDFSLVAPRQGDGLPPPRPPQGTGGRYGEQGVGGGFGNGGADQPGRLAVVELQRTERVGTGIGPQVETEEITRDIADKVRRVEKRVLAVTEIGRQRHRPEQSAGIVVRTGDHAIRIPVAVNTDGQIEEGQGVGIESKLERRELAGVERGELQCTAEERRSRDVLVCDGRAGRINGAIRDRQNVGRRRR